MPKQKKEHSHEFTQYTLPGKDDVKIDPNFTGVLKNIRDQLGSLNANLENYANSTDKGNQRMFWLTLVLAAAAIIQALSAYAQWKVAENAIDVQREGNSTEYAQWQYEMMRNDRLEARDVEWRRQDLQINQQKP